MIGRVIGVSVDFSVDVIDLVVFVLVDSIVGVTGRFVIKLRLLVVVACNLFVTLDACVEVVNSVYFGIIATELVDISVVLFDSVVKGVFVVVPISIFVVLSSDAVVSITCELTPFVPIFESCLPAVTSVDKSVDSWVVVVFFSEVIVEDCVCLLVKSQFDTVLDLSAAVVVGNIEFPDFVDVVISNSVGTFLLVVEKNGSVVVDFSCIVVLDFGSVVEVCAAVVNVDSISVSNLVDVVSRIVVGFTTVVGSSDSDLDMLLVVEVSC